jgi:hypothetical protein
LVAPEGDGYSDTDGAEAGASVVAHGYASPSLSLMTLISMWSAAHGIGATINESYVSRVLRLTLLAPDIVEAILDGRQPERMTLPGLLKGVPVEWATQGAAMSSEPAGRNWDVRGTVANAGRA